MRRDSGQARSLTDASDVLAHARAFRRRNGWQGDGAAAGGPGTAAWEFAGSAVRRLAEGMTPDQKETLVALPGSLRVVALESMESRLDRDIYSDRQLEAVMTDFWLNHFNVYVRKNQNEPYLLRAYERETIRPNALGNFEDLLVATAKSPAMLEYLDNFRSVGPDSPAGGAAATAQEMNPDGDVAKQKRARAERELRARADGAAHAWGERRLHAGGRDEWSRRCLRAGRLGRPGNKARAGQWVTFV